MTDFDIIRHINDGANFYVDFFANAEHMERIDTGCYTYTRPKPGASGIEFVYNVQLNDLPEVEQLQKIFEIKSLKMPIWWDLQMPEALFLLIHGKVREKLPPIPSDGDELYMAVLSEVSIPNIAINSGMLARKVSTPQMFAEWADKVNEWLNRGFPDVHPQNHYHACQSGAIDCYALHRNGVPVCVCSVMNNAGICSLEFVATRPDSRRQGFAKYLCAYVMHKTFENGAKLISVRAINPGTRELYGGLGFKIYNYAL
jgi:ribosomal protein S18 acetylase RimI-like enzyme